MTESIHTFADYRQTCKTKHYINSLRHVNEVLKLALENKNSVSRRLNILCVMVKIRVFFIISLFARFSV